MTRHWPIALLIALVFVFAPMAHAGELTAADLIALVKAGLGEDTIRAQIDVTGAAIVLAPADLLALKAAGASEALIQHAIRTRAATATATLVLAPETPSGSLGPVVRPHPAVSTTYDLGSHGPWAWPYRGYGRGYVLGGYGYGGYALGDNGWPFDGYGSPYGYSVGRGPVRFYNDRRTYERSLELGLGHTVPFGWGYR